MTTRLTFLGTGDAMGVPRVYCECEVCNEARSHGGRNRRLRSSLHIHDDESGDTLIDCGPDWGRQMELAGLRSPDRILITHAHFDHYGGLVEWADSCRWLKRKGQAYAPQIVIDEISARFPWLSRQISFHSIDDGAQFGSFKVRCWKVNHGYNGYSYAYKFNHADTDISWVYCSDAISLDGEQIAPLFKLDLLILGTSFYKEPFPLHTRSVYDITEGLTLIEQVQPTQTVFTHLSHDIDLNKQYHLPDNVSLATTGMSILL
ncbi:MBL fold metallo-hydrolase [Paenibacillaceae bacterium]|nr:MBL fold metallo-hydrolase [Paenibacillaceae bacterium]